MNKRELMQTVRDFRKGICDGPGQSPDNRCFMVCFPLQSFLALLGVKTKLIEGTFRNFNHYWLELEDGTVIDPTADQFERGYKTKMPKVYIGPRREWYETHKD